MSSADGAGLGTCIGTRVGPLEGTELGSAVTGISVGALDNEGLTVGRSEGGETGPRTTTTWLETKGANAKRPMANSLVNIAEISKLWHGNEGCQCNVNT